MLIPWSDIWAKALMRPGNYVERVKAMGIPSEMGVEMTVSARDALKLEFAPFDEPPDLALDLSNYDQALALWRTGGIPLVPKEVYLERRQACHTPLCSFFAITKRGPAGRCELLATYLGSCSSIHLALALACCLLQPPQQRWCSLPAATLH